MQLSFAIFTNLIYFTALRGQDQNPMKTNIHYSKFILVSALVPAFTHIKYVGVSISPQWKFYVKLRNYAITPLTAQPIYLA